jgi:hypothetical protein
MAPTRSRLLVRGLSLGLLTASLAIVGCGGGVGNVSGTVTYEGKPLKGGSVTLMKEGGATVFSGTIAEDGKYTVNGVQGGTYKVCVDTSYLKPPAAGNKKFLKGPAAPKGFKPPPDMQLPEGYTPSNPAEAAAQASAKKYVAIPEKYSKAETTDLTYTATSGDQTFDIELK